jgi:hypothetical protein
MEFLGITFWISRAEKYLHLDALTGGIVRELKIKNDNKW